MATGRTSPRFTKFQIEDSGGAMRDIWIKTFPEIGLTYDELDVSALQELVKSFVTGQANFGLDLVAVWSNAAAATASASGEASEDHISGSHTVLEPLNGSLTPRSFGVYFGVQGHWATGDPVFGAVDSIIVTKYAYNPMDETVSFRIVKSSEAANDPDWGTAAITAS